MILYETMLSLGRVKTEIMMAIDFRLLLRSLVDEATFGTHSKTKIEGNSLNGSLSFAVRDSF
jgi:hypothetical protein